MRGRDAIVEFCRNQPDETEKCKSRYAVAHRPQTARHVFASFKNKSFSKMANIFLRIGGYGVDIRGSNFNVHMSTGVSTSTDKIIVDRSRSHRNKAVSKAVRQTRERLQSGHSSSPAFDREALRMYMAAVLQGASIMPLFVIIIAALGVYFTGNTQIFLWALLTLTAHAVNVFLVRRARKQEITAENARKWRRMLLFGQMMIGCCWAVFALQSC